MLGRNFAAQRNPATSDAEKTFFAEAVKIDVIQLATEPIARQLYRKTAPSWGKMLRKWLLNMQKVMFFP